MLYKLKLHLKMKLVHVLLDRQFLVLCESDKLNEL